MKNNILEATFSMIGLLAWVLFFTSFRHITYIVWCYLTITVGADNVLKQFNNGSYFWVGFMGAFLFYNIFTMMKVQEKVEEIKNDPDYPKFEDEED